LPLGSGGVTTCVTFPSDTSSCAMTVALWSRSTTAHQLSRPSGGEDDELKRADTRRAPNHRTPLKTGGSHAMVGPIRSCP
jgi:hypothetical protein